MVDTEKDGDDTWRMNGPNTVLVTKASATHGRYWEEGPEHMCAIARTHSEMVKFEPQDHEYDKVLSRLLGVARRAHLAPKRREQNPQINTSTQLGASRVNGSACKDRRGQKAEES
jgi:hypothetical protein